MNKSFDLSIIIVSYNNKKLLQNCLNSIHENISGKFSFEVFVVDNNSTDNSLQMIQEHFPNVKVIDNQENLGFAKANNQAMRLATGRYFLLLNNDTFVFQDSIEKLISFLDQHSEIGAASPKLLNADGHTTQLQGSSLTKYIWLKETPTPVKFISGAAFVIRQKTYLNVGELDEKFFFYNEDLDWCKRIIDHGWSIYYYPESTIIHYGGQSSKQLAKKLLIEGLKGGLYYSYKHYPLLYPLYALSIIIYALLEISINLLKLLLISNKKKSWQRLEAFAIIIYLVITNKIK